jgi:hypothetical protein
MPWSFRRGTTSRTVASSSGGCSTSRPVSRNPASRPVCCSKSRNIAIESPATRARNAFV